MKFREIREKEGAEPVFDIIMQFERTSPEIVKEYAKLQESASINESLPQKNGALHSSIRAVWPGMRLCGTAFTVQCGVGDNIMLHKAITLVRPGEVLMVTNRDYDEAGGMFGGMMAASAKARGAAGLVIEGACRDTMLIKELNFPTFARNICIKATTKAIPGLINHPIIIGGVLVHPGDLVFGDNDSVVVVPREQAAEVLKIAKEREEREDRQLQQILDGGLCTFDFFSTSYQKLNLKEEPSLL